MTFTSGTASHCEAVDYDMLADESDPSGMSGWRPLVEYPEQRLLLAVLADAVQRVQGHRVETSRDRRDLENVWTWEAALWLTDVQRGAYFVSCPAICEAFRIEHTVLLTHIVADPQLGKKLDGFRVVPISAQKRVPRPNWKLTGRGRQRQKAVRAA